MSALFGAVHSDMWRCGSQPSLSSVACTGIWRLTSYTASQDGQGFLRFWSGMSKSAHGAAKGRLPVLLEVRKRRRGLAAHL